jgi:transcription antitermination factor NusG
LSSFSLQGLHGLCEGVGEQEGGELTGFESKWYAVFTMTRHEKRLTCLCAERRIESFLPLYRVRNRWKNRCTVTVELPLFPNYVFVRINAQKRVQILRLPGVLSIVSSGRNLLPVPDDYVALLRDGLLAHKIEPHPNMETGDRVCITAGPMAGMEGVLDRKKSGLRVVVRLEMIGRSVAVEVDAMEISQVGPKRLTRSFAAVN